MLGLIICKNFYELLWTFTLIFCEIIEGTKIVCQLYFSRVPTAPSPGKVLEFYNFIKNPGTMGVNLEK